MDTHICHTDSEWLKSNMKKKKKVHVSVDSVLYINRCTSYKPA